MRIIQIKNIEICYRLGSCLNAAIAGHNNPAVIYILSQLSTILIQLPDKRVPFAQGVYRAPFKLLQLYYDTFGWKRQIDVEGATRGSHLYELMATDECIKYAKSRMGVPNVFEFDPENLKNYVTVPSSESTASGVCSPLGVACATANSTAIRLLLSFSPAAANTPLQVLSFTCLYLVFFIVFHLDLFHFSHLSPLFLLPLINLILFVSLIFILIYSALHKPLMLIILWFLFWFLHECIFNTSSNLVPYRADSQIL